MVRGRKFWVLYLVEEDFEIPVWLSGGAPPGNDLVEREAARARAALKMPSSVGYRLRLLPLLCHQGVLYYPGGFPPPVAEGCSRLRMVLPHQRLRLY